MNGSRLLFSSTYQVIVNPAATTVLGSHAHPRTLVRIAHKLSAFLESKDDLKVWTRAFSDLARTDHSKREGYGERHFARDHRRLLPAFRSLLALVNDDLGLGGEVQSSAVVLFF